MGKRTLDYIRLFDSNGDLKAEGVQFKSGSIYIEWRKDYFEDDKLDKFHRSVYECFSDLEKMVDEDTIIDIS